MNLFDGSAMATGYASARPPVHAVVMDRIAAVEGWTHPISVVLDLGCGAGLSTRAALPWARAAIGVDPAPAMVAAARAAVPGALFVAGPGEQLPIRAQTIDVITAAGSLNFMDLDRFSHEAARVLKADGLVVAYDFATGCRCASAPNLAAGYANFATRWSRPTADRTAIDLKVLNEGTFEVLATESFVVTLNMGLDRYVDYLMTETNVAAAVLRGENASAIRTWCATTFAPTFATPLPVEFDTWYAVMRPRAACVD